MDAYRLHLESLDFVKAAFVRSLRAAYAHPSVPQEYRYSKKHSERQISIYRSWPGRTVKYPLILVRANTVETPISSLGDEIVVEDYNETTKDLDSQVYSGVMWVPTTVEILAKTIKDRDRVTSLTAFYIRHLFLPFFKKVRLEYLDINIEAPEDQEEVQGEMFHVGRVNIRCQTEYRHALDLTMFAAMRAVNIAGLRYGTSEDDLEAEP